MLFVGWFRRTSSQAETDSTDPDSGEKINEAEESKKESLIAKTIRAIRNKFIDRKLQGRIMIYRISGVVSTTVTCDILTGDKRSIFGEWLIVQCNDEIETNLRVDIDIKIIQSKNFFSSHTFNFISLPTSQVLATTTPPLLRTSRTSRSRTSGP